MTDHTMQPGYKLLTNMVDSKKSSHVKSYWTTATDENKTNVRLCLAKLKEEKLKLERKIREMEKYYQRALKVEEMMAIFDAESDSKDDSQVDELAPPVKKAKPAEEKSSGGSGSILGGLLGFGGGSSSSSSSGTTEK